MRLPSAFTLFAALVFAGCTGTRPPADDAGDGSTQDGGGDAAGDVDTDAAADAGEDTGTDAGGDAAEDGDADAAADGTDAGDAGADGAGDADADADTDGGDGGDAGEDGGADAGTDGGDAGDAGDAGPAPTGDLLLPGESPAWAIASPSGTRAALGLNAAGTYSLVDLYLAKLDAAETPALLGPNAPLDGVTWSSDGSALAFIVNAQQQNQRDGQLKLLAAGSTSPSQKGAAVPAGSAHFSGSGQRVAFLGNYSYSTHTGAWFTATGSTFAAQAVPASILYYRTDAARTVMVALGNMANQDDTGKMYSVDLATGTASLLYDPQRAYEIDIAPAGDTIAYTTAAIGDLYVAPASGTGTPTLVASTACCMRFAGTRLVYLAGANTDTLYSTSVPVVAPVELATTVTPALPFLSPDGGWVQYIAAYDTAAALGDLYVVKVAGGTPLLLAEDTQYRAAIWHPSSTRIAAVSTPFDADGAASASGAGTLVLGDLGLVTPLVGQAGFNTAVRDHRWAGATSWLLHVDAPVASAVGTLFAVDAATATENQLATGVPRFMYAPVRAGVGALFIAGADGAGTGTLTYRGIATGNASALAPAASWFEPAGDQAIYGRVGGTYGGIYKIALP
jgi:hypothetical protein